MRRYGIVVTVILAIVFSIFLFPDVTVEAAELGISLWLKAVLPSLFPFIVLMNMLVELDFFMLVGRYLEPFMKKIFNLPGCGGFIWISSITSGYPIGAKIIADLLREEKITESEGQHMLHFCNNSGPLFILGTVAVSMLGIPQLGYLLLLTHLASSLMVGFLYRFKIPHDTTIKKIRMDRSLRRRKVPTIDIGKVLSNSVIQGMELMLLIGGFVILFSVLIQLLKNYGIIAYLLNGLQILWRYFPIQSQHIEGLIYGSIEVTNGISLIANMGDNLRIQVPIISFLIAWSGLSIHAQTASVIKGVPLKFYPYIKAKALQGVIAGGMSYFLLPIWVPNETRAVFKYNGITTHIFSNYTIIMFMILLWLLFIVLVGYKKEDS